MKRRIMTVLGTRPEIIRLSAVIKQCDRVFDQVLVHTGQNYDHSLYEVFFDDLELRAPDHYLGVAGKHLGETIGNIISRSYELMLETKPEALLVLGDTNSALCAIPAKRLKIPVFHMEAGNRCFDENVPEEINRRLVDHISDVNLTYTEHGRRYLLSEGVRKDHVFVTGSPMPEVLHEYRDRIERSTILNDLDLEAGSYFLVSAHREENLDIEENFTSLVESLNAVAETYSMPVVYSTHPRSMKRIKDRKIKFHNLIRNLEPFGFFDYNKLQMSAYTVLSDSGTLSEESAVLRFPAVLIRTSTERPEALDAGSMVIGGIRSRDLLSAIELTRGLWSVHDWNIPADYTDTNVSVKVVKIIESYIKIINRVTWFKREEKRI